MAKIDDAKATLKTVIIDKLSSYGGQQITSSNGAQIANDIVEGVQEDDVSWAIKEIAKNLES